LTYAAFVLVLVAVAAVVVAFRVRAARRQPAVAEYLIYLPKAQLPPEHRIKQRLIQGNPHNRPERPALSAQQRAIVGDLRLSIGVANRDNNPVLFRPDLFEAGVVAGGEQLQKLSACTGIARVLFAAEKAKADGLPIGALPHLVDSIAELTEGPLIYDRIQGRLWDSAELHRLLSEDPDGSRFALHVRSVWTNEDGVGKVETMGLRKKGLHEITAEGLAPDRKETAVSLVLEVARSRWDDPANVGPWRIDHLGVPFELLLEPGSDYDRLRVKSSQS
jgi:hypothetical protein